MAHRRKSSLEIAGAFEEVDQYGFPKMVKRAADEDAESS
jgi:hypothetical protein